MDTQRNNIIVPWDFSPSSDFALEQAIQIAKVRNLNILLLHFIKHSDKDHSLLDKLSAIASLAGQKSGVTVEASVTQGTVYKSLLTEASKQGNDLIVMKTDGITNIQKYIGSRAIKMIRGIQIPTFVVQKMPTEQYFNKIVFPIDFRPENKELLSAFFHQINRFNPLAQIILIKPHSADSKFQKSITNNINFSKKILTNKNINFDIIESAPKENYANEIIRIAHSVEADLIIVQLDKQLGLTKFIFGVKEQQIIANPYKIPVLCINPKHVAIYQGFN